METCDPSMFRYIYSCSLDANVQVKIISLRGNALKPQYQAVLDDPFVKFSGLYQSSSPDLQVRCQVFSDGVPSCLSVTSAYKAFDKTWTWNEWISLPILFSDVTRNAKLAITIFDCAGTGELTAIGGTTISMFGKQGLFRQGGIELQVWPHQAADPSLENKTPGKPLEDKSQMSSFNKMMKKFNAVHQNTETGWMDHLTFRAMETINEKEEKDSKFMYLMIEFPEIILNNIPYNVVYYEKEALEEEAREESLNQITVNTVSDPELSLENLVEEKYRKLTRSVRGSVRDEEQKPNALVRDMLNTIVHYPPTRQLTTDEQDLIWTYRFYLRNIKKASVKFLECINWNSPGEVQQALNILERWALMDIEDALRLLSPRFQNPLVRRYAVTRLQQASDEDLLLYLLQLVQALRYENLEEIDRKYKQVKFIISKPKAPIASNSEQTLSSSNNNYDDSDIMNYFRNMEENNPSLDLAAFLINRACKNFNLANFFYWYLMIECEVARSSAKDIYLTVKKIFMSFLQHGNTGMVEIYSKLNQQRQFTQKLLQVVKTATLGNGNREEKIRNLQSFLRDSKKFEFNFSSFESTSFPLDPSITIRGVIPEKATLFKSKLTPSKLTFVTTELVEKVAIFKYGDDLRQDQLVLQIITLMDKLLRSENLDLKLTPYRVLAMGTNYGLVEFVESSSVAEVLNTEGTIQNFFRKHFPNENGPCGISSEVMDTYVRSCAGYCVITYLLGVGDRHLDNLLLTTKGKLFHIDFGFILGRDPKPLPPPMKLTKEMIEGMGGMESGHCAEFRMLCYTAFLHLRRHSNLILNLFSLMVDTSIPDIALEPDKAVKKVQDKFRLDLNDEEAVHYFQTQLDTSAEAVMAVLVDHLHKFTQYWKK